MSDDYVDDDNAAEPDETGRKGEERLFVHDVCTSFQSMYPHDLQPQTILPIALGAVKGCSQFPEMRSVLCDSPSGRELFDNLFWLFFCLRFQPATFSELGVLNPGCVSDR